MTDAPVIREIEINTSELEDGTFQISLSFGDATILIQDHSTSEDVSPDVDMLVSALPAALGRLASMAEEADRDGE